MEEKQDFSKPQQKKNYRKLILFFVALVVVGGAVMLFGFLGNQSPPEETAHSFGGLIVSVGQEGDNSFVVINGVPILDDSTIEPPKEWGDRKIIIPPNTLVEKRVSSFVPSEEKKKQLEAGLSVSVDESEMQVEVTPMSISDFRKGMNIVVFSDKNIFSKNEFTAKRVQLNIYDF